MTSSMSNNRCKLLILDLNINQISVETLWAYCSSCGQVDGIRIFPESTSAVVCFVDPLTVDHLITYRTCLIGQNYVRLRRFRLDQDNWRLDSHTLYVKSHSTGLLTESVLRHCFADYQSQIVKIDVIHPDQALISFVNYDFVDQILLTPTDAFRTDNSPLIFERMIDKITKPSRWDQPAAPLTSVPTLAVRDPLVHKLISHIEHLSKRLREQPNRIRNEIDRLEAEMFILKNENAQLKSRRNFSSEDNIEQRLVALEDISNRLMNKQYDRHRRERSESKEKPAKRRRKYKVDDD